jgi:hypothetical protein
MSFQDELNDSAAGESSETGVNASDDSTPTVAIVTTRPFGPSSGTGGRVCRLRPRQRYQFCPNGPPAADNPDMDVQSRPQRLARGEGLVFVIAPFRSGSTLLRKVLDSHSQIYSPAETWFLLPLLNLWDGHGEMPHFNAKQAATALKVHLEVGQFMECCRAFAGSFYASNLPTDARWFVDKTPLYLRISHALPDLFPQARFIVLARDPRGLAWSRYTWQHSNCANVEQTFSAVAGDLQRLAQFLGHHAERSRLVRYESLCDDPQTVTSDLCQFLDVPHEPGMIDYGSQTHHDGYGDEKSNGHRQPHKASLDRWAGPGGLDADQQQKLIDQCGREALEILEYPGLSAGKPHPATSRKAG